MRQVRVRIKSRLRQTTVADPPTISRKIARTWFPESALLQLATGAGPIEKMLTSHWLHNSPAARNVP